MRRIIIFSYILFLSFTLTAQVLDDSTKQIYSNKSVEFVYEKDVLRNIDRKFHPDSTLTDYHIPDPVRKAGRRYQDLGNIGTSARALFFEKEFNIGQQMGMESHNLYTPKPDRFKYYNTRSPYTYLQYLQGGGYTQFEIIHSQNVNPGLNFTFNIYKFNSEKQYGFTRNGEVLDNNWQYNLGSNYESQNKKYKIMGIFYHFNHKQAEQGGVKNGDEIGIEDIEKKYDRVYGANLNGNVYNRERWNNLHIYQQLLMKNAFQTFHILDYEQKFYGFIDPAFRNNVNSGAYPGIEETGADTLNYNARLHSLSNRLGFKGIYCGFNYQAFLRHRIYNLSNKDFENYSQPWTQEISLGGLAGYVFPDSTNTLDITAELSPDFKAYVLNADLHYQGFELSFYNSGLPAGLLYKSFDNGLIKFSNPNLKPVNSRVFSAKFPFRYKAFAFVPEGDQTGLSNYVYLDGLKSVKQLESDLNLLSLSLTGNFKTRSWELTHKYSWNNSSDKSAFPVPTHMQFTRVEFNFLYAKVLRVFTGMEMYYHSSYKGMAYSPLLNHFYAQNEKEVAGVPVLDFYIKFPINKGRFMLNYTYANKGGFGILNNVGAFGRNGFFATPDYLHNPNALMVKVDWPLFD